MHAPRAISRGVAGFSQGALEHVFELEEDEVDVYESVLGRGGRREGGRGGGGGRE